MNGLSNVQKGQLAILAKQAYQAALRHHAADDLSEGDWRAREAVSVAGVRISEAQQGHYLALKRHFEDLAGVSGQAFRTAMREPEEALIRGRHLVAEALAKWGLHPSYAEAIAKGRRFQQPGGVADLDEEGLRQLLYIVNNRGRAKAGKGQPGDRNKLQRASGKASAADVQGSSTAPADPAGDWPR